MKLDAAVKPQHVGGGGKCQQALAYEKYDIVNAWEKAVSSPHLKQDISYHEHERIYGKNWVNFISSCKAMLGVESGASVMDFTGELEKTIGAHLEKYPNDNFHTIQKLFLKEHEGLFKLNQISPRCFEAIALKTALILYEGEYSGILIPDQHYIVLKKDFSNIDDVLSKLNNPDFLQRMTDRAYKEIALNPKYSYKSFITYVDEVLSEEYYARGKEKNYFSHKPKLLKLYLSAHNLKYNFIKNMKALYPKAKLIRVKSLALAGIKLLYSKAKLMRLKNLAIAAIKLLYRKLWCT